MSKKTIKKATFKDLIARKIQREKDQVKVKDIKVPSMARYLTFVKPKEDIVIDLMDQLTDKDSMSGQIEYMRKLIYFSCPMLQDPELHAELEINGEPFDVVKELFDINDTNKIGEELIELIGMGNIDEEVKNS